MERRTRHGATIRIFLVDGTPQGLRIVDRPGWTGSCLAFSRADYAEARLRSEVTHAGVYVLVGPDPDGIRPERVYVGEAEEVRVRLDSHQKEKDFWTHAYVLTTKDASLNKAHVRYLESRLLNLAREAGNASLDNGTAPPLPRLSEPEVADMESYLREALVLLPLVGVTVFDVVDAPEQPSKADSDEAPQQPVEAPTGSYPRLRLRSTLTEAEGREDSRGFLVYEGALGRHETKVMLSSYRELRERMVRTGILAPHGDAQLRLTRNFVFDSPSAAASVLSGGSKNGRVDWKDERGRTLKAIQQEAASD